MMGLIVGGNAAPLGVAKLAPNLAFVLERSAQAQRAGTALKLDDVLGLAPTATRAANAASLGVLVRTRDPEALRQRGVIVRSVLGDVVTARVSLAQLASMPSWPEVIYVEGAEQLTLSSKQATLLEPIAPDLSQSVPLSGAVGLHNRGITGKGVVVGVIDTGVDWTHLDFRQDRDGDGFEEGSRLLSIWDQTVPGNHPEGFAYGSQYTQEQIEQAIAQQDDDLVREFDANPNAPSHGTHALGIAGGDGSSSNLNLVGMAPGAELIMVKSPITADTVLDGVNYIFNQAGSRPAVANLSLGSHLGAHDGSSNFERALDALAQGPGRVIVVAAGNQGDDQIHVGGALPATAKVSFTFDLEEPVELSHVAFDFWYTDADPIEVRVVGPDGDVLGPVATGALEDASLGSGGVFVDNAHAGVNPNNGLNELFIKVYGQLLGAKNPLQAGRWTIELRAPRLGTRYNGWALNVPFSSPNANNRSTVSIPATARGVIAVGAYVSRTTWTDIDLKLERFEADNALGQIAAFSSLGPTLDGRTKPDLVAPGSLIASALARSSLPLVIHERILFDGAHYLNRGTSFAAPHVAGAAALLLQIDPTLDAKQVLEQLQQHARRDGFTGFASNNTWGSGKLNLNFSASSDPATPIVRAVDSDQNGLIDDVEILRAIRFWISGESPSPNGVVRITDAVVLWLIGVWVEQTPL